MVPRGAKNRLETLAIERCLPNVENDLRRFLQIGSGLQMATAAFFERTAELQLM